MYNWAQMRQVLALLSFHRSVKQPQLFLYFASIEQLATYFFVYNRLNYAQNILEFTSQAYSVEKSDPALWVILQEGEFAVTKSRIPFTSIGVDQAQEYDSKILKCKGGLRGITNKPAPLLKYCLTAPVIAKLSQDTRDMFGITSSEAQHHHHHSDA